MNILFDARWINNSSPDGITRYSRELIKELSKRKKLTLLVSNKDQLIGLQKQEYILTNKPTSTKELGQARRLNKYKFDIVFTPHFIFGAKGRKFKLVRTVHDLIPFNQKSKGAKLAWKLFYSNIYFLKNLLNDCEGVVTVSQTIKKKLSDLTPNNIAVVYNAPASLPTKSAKVKKEILYIGRYEDYKNVKVLVKAINELDGVALNLAGNCSAEYKNELLSLAKDKQRIRFLGSISDEEYARQLGESMALVQPSMEEGFGLPVIEAMSVGCPVICSDIDVFREVGGEAAIYFNPDSSTDLADKIRILEDNKIREQAVKSSLANAKRFSWINSASELKSFLYEVQRGGKNKQNN